MSTTLLALELEEEVGEQDNTLKTSVLFCKAKRVPLPWIKAQVLTKPE